MTKIKSTLTSMVMATPLAVAATPILPSAPGISPSDLARSAAPVAFKAQSYQDWQWGAPVTAERDGDSTSAVTQWYATRPYGTYLNSGAVQLGAAAPVRGQDDQGACWRIEAAPVGDQATVNYKAAWQRRSAAAGDGDHMRVKYLNVSAVDIGTLPQPLASVPNRNRDQGVNVTTMILRNGKWTWTQSA